MIPTAAGKLVLQPHLLLDHHRRLLRKVERKLIPIAAVALKAIADATN